MHESSVEDTDQTVRAPERLNVCGEVRVDVSAKLKSRGGRRWMTYG